jgi:hypothetical protein
MAERGFASVDPLARAADMHRETVTDALAGQRRPQDKTLRKLCVVLRRRLFWVLTGEGESRLSEAEAEEEWAKLRAPSDPALLPVSSLGIDRWLTDTLEGRRTTAAEREWLRKFPWPQPQTRYPDLVYSVLTNTYREMLAFSEPERS